MLPLPHAAVRRRTTVTCTCAVARAPARALIRTAAAIGLAAAVLTGCSGGSGNSSGAAVADTAAPVAALPPLTPLPSAQQPSMTDAARFLAQASFGPRSTGDIDNVKQGGYDAWINQQYGVAAASHVDYLTFQSQFTSDGKATEEMSYEAIWQQWLFGNDQLRARVAFALSEIFVISNVAPDMSPWALSSYMDMLNRDAFGSYRTLLEDVTLHPAMGYYLNMLRSQKDNPASGIHPNENYAREVLQLFSIGLVKLNPDGTPQLSGGQPVPTYGEDTVQGFAKAFTGWSFAGGNTSDRHAFFNGAENWTQPMQPWPAMHSTDAKTLLDGLVLPGGGSPAQDMHDALDDIFNHPNVGPFIGRRLIQRLVTSNPSPAYIARVTAVFNNNGAGVRGDLGAVVKAILLDPEARDETKVNDASFGKQREPVIRFANFLRGTRAASPSGFTDIHYLNSPDDALGESPLLSPSVFNFFSPDYRNPGPLAAAGLTAPEFQITNETSVVGSLDFFASLLRGGSYGSNDRKLTLDYSAMTAIAGDPAALADYISLMFMENSMSATTRTIITQTLAGIPAGSPTSRVRTALILTALSPDFVIQK